MKHSPLPPSSPAEPTLLPTSKAAVGAAYGNASFELLQPASATFVSSLYLTGEPAEGATGSSDRWRGFLVAAGAADGLSFVVSASNLPQGQVPKGTALRKNAKTVALPYGLGTGGANMEPI